MELEGEGEQLPLPAGANVPDGDDILPEINFDDGEQTSISCLASYPYSSQRIKPTSTVMLGPTLKRLSLSPGPELKSLMIRLCWAERLKKPWNFPRVDRKYKKRKKSYKLHLSHHPFLWIVCSSISDTIVLSSHLSPSGL